MTPTAKQRSLPVFQAILAAALYAAASPFSKLLLAQSPPAMTAAFLYLGAGAGMLLVGGVRKCRGKDPGEAPLTRQDLPYTIAMILLDIAAPVLLMFGLTATTAANASLLNNFEIVATSLIALLIFGEKISRRLWLAIGLITLSCLFLSIEEKGSLQFSSGSLLVLLACVCWGFENNCTRRISGKDPLQIVVVKGFGSGTGALLIALFSRESFPKAPVMGAILLLGFVSYGLSIFFYVHAQRGLGAAKTSAYYAVAPFIGVALSFLIFRDIPGIGFFAGLIFMAAGAWLASAGESQPPDVSAE